MKNREQASDQKMDSERSLGKEKINPGNIPEIFLSSKSFVIELFFADDIIRPPVTPDMVGPLVWRLYGLKVKDVVEMVSYDDRNFKVEVDRDVINNKHINSLWIHGFNLKVLNRKDSMTARAGNNFV